ncbi:ABC transporter permease [Streptomyces sp. NBC_00439]|uniref:ABC transporter permease n=1 Tax=Streptomyces sp. NBC_00439 TaxID=2903650 RepID=UPI002253543F|nr:ABC transporter permease [Streptomyces sp. NBC_00439]MCX5098168.1 hypothetical protein [Streptomyces sp. NBC_00439]
MAVVLGDQAALRLGVTAPGERVWLGGQWFVVTGILAPNELAPELGTAALVGWPEATAHLGADGTAAMVYLRAHPERVPDVHTVVEPPPTPPTRARSPSAALPTCTRHGPKPRTPSPDSSSPSPRSPCSWAASASPTPWSWE